MSNRLRKKQSNNGAPIQGDRSRVGTIVDRIGLKEVIVALIGLIGTCIVAYYGYLAARAPFDISIRATQTAQASLPTSQSGISSKEAGSRPNINPLPSDISGKIAFLRRDQNETYFIVSNSDGSNETVITQLSWSIICPRISPDGQRIAFVSTYEGRQRIYLINRDNTNITRLTSGPIMDECGSWSTDGLRLVYSIRYSIDNDIFVIDSDGSDQYNLTNIGQLGLFGTENYFSAAPWSPDGDRFVFHSNRDGDFELFIINRDGTGLEQLTNNSSISDYNAVWSPDGDRIAYVSNPSGGEDTDILVIDLQNPIPINITNYPSHDTDPSWSPDGTKLLFISDRDGNRDIYMMNSDGRNVHKITQSIEDEDDPVWLP